MNQKLVKALRRQAEGRESVEDRRRIDRHTAAMGNVSHPKPLKVRVHKQKKAIKATWPGSDDQKAQSRPVIIARPLKHIHERHPDLKNERGEFIGYAPLYRSALTHANLGNGRAVNYFARIA